MIDEIYDRHYREGRGALHDGIRQLLALIAESFRALHRIQFAAPWNPPERGARKPEWRRSA